MMQRPVSDDLKRMVNQDRVFGQDKPPPPEEGFPELEWLMEKALADFKERFESKTERYGEDSAFDAFMEETVEFNIDLPELLEKWLKRLLPRTEFQRGCCCALGHLKILFDHIEQLRPEEK